MPSDIVGDIHERNTTQKSSAFSDTVVVYLYIRI